MDAAQVDPPITWHETRRRLAEDRARIRAMLVLRFDAPPRWMPMHPSYLCVLLYRLAHFFWARKSGKLARLFTQANSLLTGADIHPQCDLGGGLLIPHPTALTCSGNAGANYTMMPLCGIGMLPRDKDVGAGPGLPVLGDDVWMGPGTGVLGPVRIGSATRIQPGAGATRDQSPGTLVEVATPPQRTSGRLRLRPAARNEGARPPCTHASFAGTGAAVRADIDRHLRERGVTEAGRIRRLGALLSHELLGVFVHRVAHVLHARGWPRIASAVSHLNFFVFRSAISPGACIGGGVFMPHPAGIVFHGVAGIELTMYARTLCSATRPSPHAGLEEGPRVGDRVVLSGMAAILGAVTVGDDVHLSFNAQVEDDVPAGSFLASRVKFHAVEPAAANASSSDANMDRAEAPTFAQLRRLIAEDRRALERLCDGDVPASPLLAARLCATLFRLSHHFQRHRRYRLAWCCWRLNVGLTGADIDPRSEIGSGLAIPYPVGISLHVTAGSNLKVRALAGVGAETALAENPWAVAARPVLGNDVEICEHASVHGPVRVGDGARLGPGCKVMRDVAPGEFLEAPTPRRMMAPMDEKSAVSASMSSAGPGP